MRWWVAVTVVVTLLAVGVGYGAGYLVYQPQIDSLEGTADQRASLLESSRDRVATQSRQLDELRREVQTRQTEQGRVQRDLVDREAALSALRPQLEEARTNLGSLRSDLLEREGVLIVAQDRVDDLEGQVAGLMEGRGDLEAAIALQAEILSLLDEEIRPALGDGALLVQRGNTAAENQNYGNSAAFFANAALVYGEAEGQAKEVVTKSEELSSLVPEESRESFARTRRHAEATAHMVTAQAAESRAAANLFRLLEEWAPLSGDPTSEQAQRWKKWVTDAEADIEEAMSQLDSAVDWAPELWRQFEAQRMSIRSWQGLADSIRFTILEPLEPIDVPAE